MVTRVRISVVVAFVLSSFAQAQLKQPTLKSYAGGELVPLETYWRKIGTQAVRENSGVEGRELDARIWKLAYYPRLESKAPEAYQKPFLDCARPDFVKQLCEAQAATCAEAKVAGCAPVQVDLAKLSATHRLKVLEHVSRFFSSIVSSPEMQKRCCGDVDVACQERFGAIQLMVELTTSPRDYHAAYDPSRNHVLVPEAHLFAQAIEEHNESWILHELGHACEAARGAAGRAQAEKRARQALTARFDAYMRENKVSGPAGVARADKAANAAFAKVMGDHTRAIIERDPRGACLLRGLERARKDRGLKHIPIEWLSESYPQIVFYPLFRSPAQWTSSCGEKSLERYFVECFVEDPGFKARWCK